MPHAPSSSGPQHAGRIAKPVAENIADDPPPVPPVRPELEDCCGSGCNPCVFDFYETARERYEAERAAWEARHPDRRDAQPAAPAGLKSP